MHVPPCRRTTDLRRRGERGRRREGGSGTAAPARADRCSRVRLATANIWGVVGSIETTVLLLPVASPRPGLRSASQPGPVWSRRTEPDHSWVHLQRFQTCKPYRLESRNGIAIHCHVHGSCRLPDASSSGGNYCLRTHTTNQQVRYITLISFVMQDYIVSMCDWLWLEQNVWCAEYRHHCHCNRFRV